MIDLVLPEARYRFVEARRVSALLQALPVRIGGETLERLRARVRFPRPVLQVREDRKWAA